MSFSVKMIYSAKSCRIFPHVASETYFPATFLTLSQTEGVHRPTTIRLRNLLSFPQTSLVKKHFKLIWLHRPVVIISTNVEETR